MLETPMTWFPNHLVTLSLEMVQFKEPPSRTFLSANLCGQEGLCQNFWSWTMMIIWQDWRTKDHLLVDTTDYIITGNFDLLEWRFTPLRIHLRGNCDFDRFLCGFLVCWFIHKILLKCNWGLILVKELVWIFFLNLETWVSFSTICFLKKMHFPP